MLDEPTSFLDIRYKLELLTVLKQLVREKQVAVILLAARNRFGTEAVRPAHLRSQRQN